MDESMDCILVEVKDRIEVLVTTTWKLVLALLGGILTGVMCTIVVYFIKKWFYKTDKRCCTCCSLCCSCIAVCAGDSYSKVSSISLESLVIVPEKFIDDEGNHRRPSTKGTMRSARHLIQRTTSSDSGLIGLIEEAEQEFQSDTESTQYGFEEEPDESSEYGKRITFAEILSQPSSEMASELLFMEERNTLLRFESSFIHQRSHLFLLMVDKIASKMASTNGGDIAWKKRLDCYCKSAFVKKRDRSKSIRLMTSTGIEPPDALVESKLSEMTAQLFEYLRLTLEEDTNANRVEVEEIVQEIQLNWQHFEKQQSQLYIKTLKDTEQLLRQREEIVGILDQNYTEITNEIKKHLKAHVEGLQQLMLNDVTSAMAFTARAERAAKKLEKKWNNVLEQYEKEFQAQKAILLMEAEQQIQPERILYKERHEECLHTVHTSAALTSEMSLKDCIKTYLETLETIARDDLQLDKMEIQLSATEVSSLMEGIGTKHFKHGVSREEKLYSQLLTKADWTDTTFPELIMQHRQNLKDLQANLRRMRKSHQSKLHDKIRQTMLGEGLLLNSFISDEIHSQQVDMKSVINKQTDLSETECQHLQDQCTAQLKTLQFQLELSRFRQEQELKQTLEQQQAVVAKDLRQAAKDDLQWDCSITAMVKLKNDKEALQQQYDVSIQHMQKKIRSEIESAKQLRQLHFQQQIKKIRRDHKTAVAEVQGTATKLLKSKLMDKLSEESEKTLGNRVLYQHQVSKEGITDTIEKTKTHQEQVLQQKLQARKLEKSETPKTSSQANGVSNYKLIVANVLVELLTDVRCRRINKELEEELSGERLKIIQRMKRRCQVQSNLEMKHRETEMTVKLASVLNMTRAQLEMELKKQ